MHPIYYFRVNLLSQDFNSNLQPDKNFDNILNQLQHATVWVEGVPRALKHGDAFTLKGKQAEKVNELYITGRQSPFVLEMFDIDDVTGLEGSSTDGIVSLSWSGNSDFYTYIETRVGNGQWAFLRQVDKGENEMSIEADEGSFQVRFRFTDGLGNFSRHFTMASIDVEAISIMYSIIETEDLNYLLTTEDGEFYICYDINP